MATKKKQTKPFMVGRTTIYIWIDDDTKKTLKAESKARDLSLTKLVRQILNNAADHLRSR